MYVVSLEKLLKFQGICHLLVVEFGTFDILLQEAKNLLQFKTQIVFNFLNFIYFTADKIFPHMHTKLKKKNRIYLIG